MNLTPGSTLSMIKRVQAETMDDRCNIIHVSFGSGTYGNSLETRTLFMSNVPCGIEFTGGKIVQRGETMFVDYDCLLRIADDVPVSMNDEIVLVEKGEFLISGTFKPFSAPVVNSSVQKIQLKRQAL